MATMNEERLRRPVLCVVRRLLFPDPAEVPEVDPSVRAGGREDGLVVRGPGELEYLVFVRLERVQLRSEVSQVPETDCLQTWECVVSTDGDVRVNGGGDGPCLRTR